MTDLQDPEDLLVPLVPEDPQDPEDHLDHLGHLDLSEDLDQLEKREVLDPPALLDLQDQAVPLDQEVSPCAVGK